MSSFRMLPVLLLVAACTGSVSGVDSGHDVDAGGGQDAGTTTDGGGDAGSNADAGADAGTSLWSPTPLVFSFTQGTAATRSFAGAVATTGALTFTAVGSWPAGVTVNSAARTLDYDGVGPTALVDGLQLSADDGAGRVERSNAFTVAITDGSAVPQVTYDVAVQSTAGHDGAIAWESVFLLNDGRIASFGTGNHAHEQSNAITCIDPLKNPPNVDVYDLFPWTQVGYDQPNYQPNWMTGTDLFVDNYDNHPSMYLASANQLLWVNHGVFDVAMGTWLYGNRPPFTAGQNWDAFLLAFPNFEGTFNPAVAWCDGPQVGVFYGNSEGGYGARHTDLLVVEPNPDYPGTDTHPWHLVRTDLASQGAKSLDHARNIAVCLGNQLYVGGPLFQVTPVEDAFMRIDVQSHTVQQLTPYPAVGDHFPQLVYDSHRNRLVLIGQRVMTYSLTGDAWRDVTPAGWPGYTQVMGVYQPTLDAIYFRGKVNGMQLTIEPYFHWHRLVFTD